MTLAISIDKALQVIFAFSAMEARENRTAPKLGTDDTPALKVIARNVLSGIISSVGTLISDPDFDSDPDIVSFNANVDTDSEVGPVISAIISSTLCAGILAEIHAGDPAKAERYASIHRSELTLLQSRLGRFARLNV